MHASRRADSVMRRGRVQAVLNELEVSPDPTMSVSELARRAEVHRAFLYRHEDLLGQYYLTQSGMRSANTKLRALLREADLIMRLCQNCHDDWRRTQDELGVTAEFWGEP
jgi:hypothetical protein